MVRKEIKQQFCQNSGTLFCQSLRLKANPPKQELQAIFLGKLRKDIKKNLVEEMKEIDNLVKKIIG